MMSMLRLAAKNLLRSKRRSALTGVALVTGVGLFILGEAFVSGIEENIVVSAIDNTVGHVMARPAGYPDQVGQYPVDDLLQLTDEARALLDEEAVAWTERLYFAPLAVAGRELLRVTAIGYDPERDTTVFPRDLWRIDGAMPDDTAREVLVSARLARLLELKVGSQLVLQVRAHRGAINALEVRVVGLVGTGNAVLDGVTVFVPGPLAEELVATRLPSHVSAKLSSRDSAGDFATRLTAAMAGRADTVTWETETAELLALQQIRRAALDIVMAILMALAGFGIANTILMAAYERVREVGTLRAMGMTELGVVRLFLMEGAMVGIVGGALGAAWGGALAYHWSRSPIDITEMTASTGKGSMSFSTLLYTAFDPQVIFWTAALAVGVAIIASIYPARVASRMAPAEAVRAS